MKQEKDKMYKEIEIELYDDWRAEWELEKQNEIINRYIQKVSINNETINIKEMKIFVENVLNEIKDRKFFYTLVENELYKVWELYSENEEEQNKIIEEFVQRRMEYHKTMTAREMKECATELLKDIKEKKDRNKVKKEKTER